MWLVDRLRAAGVVFAEDEARLLVETASDADELRRFVARRADGVPVEQIVGWAEFCGLRVGVRPGVFVPRRRTEFLATLAIAAAREAGRSPVVLDLCCGSGAVALAVSSALPGAEVHAADVDDGAVACARANLAGAPGAQVHQGDLFDALPQSLRGRVDVLAANAPYVPSDAIRLMPQDAREHEPLISLDGGPDGLAVLGRITSGCVAWLAPGGTVLVETSARQAAGTAALFAAAGFRPRTRTSRRDGGSVVMATRRSARH